MGMWGRSHAHFVYHYFFRALDLSHHNMSQCCSLCWSGFSSQKCQLICMFDGFIVLGRPSHSSASRGARRETRLQEAGASACASDADGR